jgi:hypothetical protein
VSDGRFGEEARSQLLESGSLLISVEVDAPSDVEMLWTLADRDFGVPFDPVV